MNALILLIYNAVLNGAPLMYGTMGEVLTEKSGNLNLGVEGMMYMGGAIGLGAAFYYEKMAGAAASGPVAVVLAILFAFAAGAFGALIYSWITISARQSERHRTGTFHFRYRCRSVYRRVHACAGRRFCRDLERT